MKANHYLVRLYHYNAWANEVLIGFLKAQNSLPDRIPLLYSHVLTAQSNWLNRVLAIPHQPIAIWETLPWDELHALAHGNAQRWLNFLETADEAVLENLVPYINMQQKPYQSSAADIALQCVNHATYHRAQIAQLLRQHGIAPPNTDYITWTRVISSQPL
jgi:uncharacterized damage-inducible protein DinB